jgi:hypothetical protein
MEDYGSNDLMEEFVSGRINSNALANYFFATGKRLTKCKVKGIALNYKN